MEKAPRRQIPSAVRLSCEGCTKRKVKCDRLIPCTNCQNLGVLCVPVERRRLPRGRSRRPENMPSQANSSHLSIQGLSDHITDLAGTARNNRTRSAWDRREQPNNNISWAIDQCRQVVPNETLFAQAERLDSYQERQQLLHIYLTQVDPIVKILHRPSLREHLIEGNCYLNYDPWHPAPAALASAIYYAASCTVSAETCLSCFGTDKPSLIAKYQRDTNYALDRADYLITDDFTILQAFVISLIAMRCHDRTRRFWTMLALAVRIAQALSLHDPNPPFPVTPFEREMRRRLWHAIGWLDVQASLSNASESMMQSDWLGFHPFLDLDDDEFGTDLEIPLSPQRKVSETSVFHLLSYAQETARLLIISSSITPYTEDAYQRQQLILTFKKRTEELFVGIQPNEVNFHWYLKELAHSIGVFLQLLAVRPLQKNTSLENPQTTSISILRLAVEALDSRCRVYSSTKTQRWRWIQPLFFPWQALAVALAEIRACDDLCLVESVWPLIEQSYRSFTTLEIELSTNRLRKSMHNMMEQARKFHDSMFLMSLTNESEGSALSRGLPLPSMLQHQVPSYQENDVSTWINDREIDEVDFECLGSDRDFENTASFENAIFQTLHDVSDQGLFYQ